MVYSAIDVGSNTLRLLIAEAGTMGLTPLRYDRVITRLASGVRDTGRLSQAATQKSLSALAGFSRTISSFGVATTRVVGTSALREAENTNDFISDAREMTGLAIEVISGEDEARLTALGALSSLGRPPSYMIVDIGGGSTEIIYSGVGGATGHISERIGAVNLFESHIKSDPPSLRELESVKAECARAVKSIRARMAGFSGDTAVLIGTAGTASTLAAIDLGLTGYDSEKIHGHVLPLERLQKMAAVLGSMRLAERAGVRGLEPERADLIIPGIILTISLMETFGFNSIKISEKGLLEGIVLDMAKEAPK